MSTSNDELMMELREVRRVVEELHSRPSVGLLVSRLVDKLFDPRVLIALGFLVATSGVVLGRVLTIEGFGVSISTGSQRNEWLASEADDVETGLTPVPASPEP